MPPDEIRPLKLSPLSRDTCILFAVMSLLWVATGGQTYSAWSKTQSLAHIPLFLFIMMSLCLATLIYGYSRIDFKRPLIQISPDGIEHQTLSKIVPRTSVERIEPDEDEKDGVPLKLYFVLRADTDPAILADLARRHCGPNVDKIQIVTRGWSGTSPSMVKKTIDHYMTEFGQPAPVTEPQ